MKLESPMLHLAAMSFPSYQGTQAVIRSMLEALHGRGKNPHLLAYAGSGYHYRAPYQLHRIADFPPYRSLRAGPSPIKVMLDARMALTVGSLARRIAAGVIVAHNVEAAAAALSARSVPVIFFAHTDMETELPCYPLGVPAFASRIAGAMLDGFLARQAAAVATISPLLQDRFSRLLQDSARKAPGLALPEVCYLPPPWPVPETVSEAERARCRTELGYGPEDRVLLYAGNLDRYQGWEAVLGAARVAGRADRRLRLLFATESDPAPLWREARKAEVADRLRVTSLRGEPARKTAHAAADVAVVPRRAAGGLPIKLLEALARGVPTVAAPLAAAGLQLNGAVMLARESDQRGLADLISIVCNNGGLRRELSRLGPAYVSEQHGAERFVSALYGLRDRLAARTVGTGGQRERRSRACAAHRER